MYLDEQKPSSDSKSCIPIYSSDYARISGIVMQTFFYGFLAAFLLLGIFKILPIQVFWSTVHQYQMILLIPLLGSYIPQDVIDTMLFSEFLWRPLAFFDISKWFQIHIPYDWTHNSNYVNSSRMHYDCFLINIFQTMVPLLLLLFVWLIIFLIKRRYQNLQNWFMVKVATLSVLMAILFRFFILTFTFLIHSSSSSLESLNVTDDYNMISLFLNLVYLWIAAFTTLVLARVSVKKWTQDYIKSEDPTIELTKEIRFRNLSHFYVHWFLARRIISAAWIITTQHQSPRLRIGVFIVINIIWAGYR